MSSSLLNFLAGVVKASEICNELPASQITKTDTTNGLASSTFKLPQCDMKSFDDQLSKRNISREVREGLRFLFQNTAELVQATSTERTMSLIQELQQRQPQISNNNLTLAMRKLYINQVHRVQDAIIREVDAAISRFHVDAEASAQSEGESSSSSSEDGLNVSRGLPPLATRLFEAVYARTDKITQAERDRLSEASGVPPRSVTIWFQNRRNRPRRTTTVKTEAQAEEISLRATPLPPLPSSPVAASPPQVNRKRKAGLYDDEEGVRMPSDDPRQRRRLSISTSLSLSPPRHHSGSSSSSSSMTASSNDSLYSWSQEAAERLRNVSWDTNFSSTYDDRTTEDDVSEQNKREEKDKGKGTSLIDSPVLSEVEMPMLFDSRGNVQLGFADLQLDLGYLKERLSGAAGPSFTMAQHGGLSPDDAESEPAIRISKTSQQPSASSSRFPPTSPLLMATLLNQATISVPNELRRASLNEKWTFDPSKMLEGAGDEWFVKLDVPTPSTSSSSSSWVASPQTPSRDLFNFDLESLQIHDIVQANIKTYDCTYNESTPTPTPTAHHFCDAAKEPCQLSRLKPEDDDISMEISSQ